MLLQGGAAREKQFSEKGSRIIGDCDPRMMCIAGAVTPAPGGIGKLTIAMLMINTLKAAKMRRGIKPAKPETALQG